MARLLSRILFAAFVILTSGTGFAQEAVRGVPEAFATKLQGLGEIHVATDRKDGTRSSAAPVWFGVMDGALWFTTSPESHKGKRVERGSPVYVSVDGAEGPFVKMKAEIVRNGDKADELGEIYKKKYWIAWLGFFRPGRARNESGKTILLKLTPAT